MRLTAGRCGSNRKREKERESDNARSSEGGRKVGKKGEGREGGRVLTTKVRNCIERVNCR